MIYPSATREKGILELICNDVFRFIIVPLLGKPTHYILFIDNLFRNTLVYFLQKKSKVLNKFEEFKALAKN